VRAAERSEVELMATGIQWTEETWNPTVGCSVLSPGCTNCYAMQMAARLAKMGQQKYGGLTRRVNGRDVWTGEVRLHPPSLLVPLVTKKPTLWFTNSMSDLFHEALFVEDIAAVFAVMALAHWHRYQVLTKRAERMRTILTDPDFWLLVRDHCNRMVEEARHEGAVWEKRVCYGMTRLPVRNPLPHVWLGVSAERQPEADLRVRELLNTPGAVRFVSAEPLLSRLDLAPYLYPQFAADDPRHDPWRNGLDWVIVGGESGKGSRHCALAWVRKVVRDCQAVGVPVFVKQLGACAVDEKHGIAGSLLRVPPEAEPLIRIRLTHPKGGRIDEWPEALRVRQMPEVAA
jgi:protein gp37